LRLFRSVHIRDIRAEDDEQAPQQHSI